MEETCTTCYHHYHNKHTMTICRHALMCNDHDKWEPYTNGDWIRTASNEDLAQFLCSVSDCSICAAYWKCSKENVYNEYGYEMWLNDRKESEDESK